MTIAATPALVSQYVRSSLTAPPKGTGDTLKGFRMVGNQSSRR